MGVGGAAVGAGVVLILARAYRYTDPEIYFSAVPFTHLLLFLCFIQQINV